MPDNPLQIVDKAKLHARRRKQLLEQLDLLVNTPTKREVAAQKPAVTEPPEDVTAKSPLLAQHATDVLTPLEKRLAPKGESDLLSEHSKDVIGAQRLRYVQEALPKQAARAAGGMTDSQLMDELGLPLDTPVEWLQALRASPESVLPKLPASSQERFNMLGVKLAELGGYLPGQEIVVGLNEKGVPRPFARDVDPKLVQLMGLLVREPVVVPEAKWKTQLRQAVSQAHPLLGLFNSMGMPSNQKLFFGDKSIADPGENILTDDVDLENFVRFHGLVGTLAVLYRALISEPVGAVSLAVASQPLNAFNALIGKADNGFNERFVDAYKANGHYPGKALLSAYQQTDFPLHMKGIAELLFDPTLRAAGGVQLGLGMLPGVSLTARGLVPRAGGLVGGASSIARAAKFALDTGLLKKPFEATAVGQQVRQATLAATHAEPTVEFSKLYKMDELLEFGGYNEAAAQAKLAKALEQANSVRDAAVSAMEDVRRFTADTPLWSKAREKAEKLAAEAIEQFDAATNIVRDEQLAAIRRGAETHGYGVVKEVATDRSQSTLASTAELVGSMDKQKTVWKPVAQFGEGATDFSNWYGVGEYAARLAARGTTKVVHAFDPRATATGPVAKLMIAWRAIADEAAKWYTVGDATLSPLVPFLRMKDGLVTAARAKVAGVSNHFVKMAEMTPDDLAKSFDFDNDMVVEFFAEWRRQVDSLYSIKKAEGLALPGEVAVYSPRILISSKGEIAKMKHDLNLSGYKLMDDALVGVPKEFQHERGYEDVLDGIKSGIDYLNNPMAIWKSHTNSVGHAIADKRLEVAFKQSGLLVDASTMVSARGKMRSIKKQLNYAIAQSRKGPLDAELSGRLNSLGYKPITDGLKSADITTGLEAARLSLDDELAVLKDILDVEGKVRLTKGGPALEGLVIPDEEVAKQIVAALRDSANNPKIFGASIGPAKDFGDAWRLAVTTLDFSAGMLQGLPVLFTRPQDWAKAMGKSFEAFFDATARARYLSEPKNLTILREFLDHQGIMGTSEFYEAAESLGQRGVRHVIAPFNRAFDTFGDVARLESYKAMRALAKTPEELDDVAKYVNHSTGVFSTARLGVSPNQRSVEALVLFSPRYNRAGLALIKDSFQGGLRGQLARDSLTHFAVWGSLSYFGISKLLGQDPKLDPRPVAAGGDGPDFMTWEIDGQRVGIGSWWLTTARLLGNVIGDVQANPDGFLSMSTIDRAFGPQGRTTRFLRGKLAPLPANVLDWALGSSYIGERVDRTDAVNWLSRTALAVSPMALQDLLEGDTHSLPGFLFEEMGMRAFDVPLMERGEEIVSRVLESKYGATKDDLMHGNVVGKITDMGSYAIDRAVDSDPEYLEWRAEKEADSAKRGDDLDLLFLDWNDAQRGVHEMHDKLLVQAETAFKTPGTPTYNEGAALRDRVHDVEVARYGKLDELRGEPRFAKLFEKLDKSGERKLAAKELLVGDLAYLDYVRQLTKNKDAYTLPDGSFDYEARDALFTRVAAEWGTVDPRFDAADITTYVKAKQSYKGTRTPPGPLWQEWITARDGPLTEYWSLPEKLFGDREDWPQIKEYLHRKDTTQAALDAPQFAKTIDRILDQQKLAWRRSHPELDALMVDMGIATKPATVNAALIFQERRQRRLTNR